MVLEGYIRYNIWFCEEKNYMLITTKHGIEANTYLIKNRNGLYK